ncbi:MAG: hypothetical protein DDT26_02691 [Dehalococcoidia bacterium]|nr:hypothetical protein [Chloroflexota bacterium]
MGLAVVTFAGFLFWLWRRLKEHLEEKGLSG